MIQDIDLTGVETEIILRMINYKNKDKNILLDLRRNQESISLDGYRSTFRSNNNKFEHSKKWKKINTLNKELISDNGWLIAEQIEYPKSPYADTSPYKNKRWDYLDNSLIKAKKILKKEKYMYLDIRGRESKEGYTLYKIDTDISVLIKLFNFFYNHKNKQLIYDFMDSDYFKDKRIFDSVAILLYSDSIMHSGNGHNTKLIEKILPSFSQKNVLKLSMLPPNFIYDFLNSRIHIESTERKEMNLTLNSLIKAYLIVAYKGAIDPILKNKYREQIINLDSDIANIIKQIKTEDLERKSKR